MGPGQHVQKGRAKTKAVAYVAQRGRTIKIFGNVGEKQGPRRASGAPTGFWKWGGINLKGITEGHEM